LKIFAAVNLYAVGFWFTTPHMLTDRYHSFRETYCLHL